MKNILTVDIDTDREGSPILIGKPEIDDNANTVIMDMACLCEALCTLIHVADKEGIRSGSDSLRNCIRHLEDGFVDPSYEVKGIK